MPKKLFIGLRSDRNQKKAHIFFIKVIYISLQSSLYKQMVLSNEKWNEQMKRKKNWNEMKQNVIYNAAYSRRITATFHLALQYK